ncbi:hypothetical protein [Flavobacterium sp. LS1P3]|jgi:hypothetical protein
MNKTQQASPIEQNEYVKDNFGKHVYILDVESGQKRDSIFR